MLMPSDLDASSPCIYAAHRNIIPDLSKRPFSRLRACCFLSDLCLSSLHQVQQYVLIVHLERPVMCQRRPALQHSFRHTFVSAHPNLNATSCANSSPKPSISPFMNGNIRLMPAPLMRPQIVGGEYRIKGELEEDGGEGEGDSSPFAS